ncbi:PREDICTED: cytoskeleton-associated protein 2-like [Nipponia nippon]|uniref:cytoskeleton-associated protein 2-like n=1 Tax=Nipponia nippon TaxID=128390 RepID=UPI000511B686|nr:PREDICTED: cytoskeleton-associated protein 2-like [Nipponia nippon]
MASLSSFLSQGLNDARVVYEWENPTLSAAFGGLQVWAQSPGEEQRRRLQEYLAAKEKLKCQSAKPFLKDRTNCPNPPLEPVSKLECVDRNKKDVVRNMVKGAQRDGKLGAKPTQHAGHAAQQKSSNASQRAVVVRPEPPRQSAKLPEGLVPSRSHSAQPRGRLPTSNSGHLDPERSKKPARETVSAAAPRTGSDHPAPGAPCSLNEGLQDKENVRAQASTHPGLKRVQQPDGNSLGNKRALAHRQSSATASRTVTGPKDRINSRQAKEEPIQDKFRKTLPGSKSAPQKPSIKTQPLQRPQLITGSTNLLHKKPGPNQEKTNTARKMIEKPLGMLPAGGLKPHSRPPQLQRPPAKPPASSRPQGTTNPKPSLKPGGTVQRQRPEAKGEAGRKDAKVVPPGCAAASRVTVPQNQPRRVHGSRTQAIESDFRSRRERLKAEASGLQARRVPKTPSAADRKKQLEEWLASKGKTYKRPPMMLLQKKPVKLSQTNVKEKEKQEKPEQLCLEHINNVLTECLKLVEEGVQEEELSAVLSRVPQAEKFAKFWICKAKLLAQSGPFDVAGLYKAAVCAGAVPLQELREVVLDILKAADQTSEGEKAKQPVPWEPTVPCPRETQHAAATPCLAGRSGTSLPVSVKLQVTSATRGRELLEGQDLKFLTPVRRSLRIERAGSRYPGMLKDHDPVVSSLSEILDAEEETQFFFRKNKALPEVAELEGLSLYPPECC